MKKVKKVLPIASAITFRGCRVTYQCGCCFYSFNVLNDQWEFCPACGKPINKDIIGEVPKAVLKAYYTGDGYGSQQQILAKIDQLNARGQFKNLAKLTDSTLLVSDGGKK